MVETKDKIVTVESLAELHNYNKSAYTPYEVISETIPVRETGDIEAGFQSVYAAMPNHSIKFVTLDCLIIDVLPAGGVWHVEIHKTSDEYGKIIANTYNAGLTCQRMIFEGQWLPWECENPSMVAGVEYRTTEKWQDKPVYTQLIDLGYLGIAGINSFEWGAGITNMLRTNAVIVDPNYGKAEVMPVITGNSFDGEYVAYVATSTASYIQIFLSSAMVGRRVYVTLWYTRD